MDSCFSMMFHIIIEPFLRILIARYEATQVFTSTPLTPPNIHVPDTISSSSNHTPTNVQLRGDVSPISICSSERD